MNRTYLKLTLDLDFILIAVTAPLKDYVLCHKINTSLNTHFEKVEDHEIYFNIDEPLWSFSKYYFFVEQGDVEYYLISNKSTDGLLVPEMSNVDFFIIIKEFIDQEDLNYLINGLNKLPDIQVAAKIEPTKLKSKENLVL
ncbi:IPExxxVDY family protein [Pedobacter mucosus]|uniref:IPExxxVDY family protein n=1 Tax=Pedobacter mucosus TaxID=2895286 RepID=UPI001EE3EE60|nr:IPExxxVDY family protein [Pedobacter mucosus]UKT63873.1 IPExxxVDY family protein [Pedobacter mucosus]